MISLEEARRIIAAEVDSLPSERVSFGRGNGRVLAESVVADAFYPSGDRSMMDGYVVRADASPGEFIVRGEIQAGDIPDQALRAGDAMRIFTGALLPEGGGRVIMQEKAERSGNRVKIPVFSDRLFVRPKGSEAAPGDVILTAGTLLGATELAMLAQIGAVEPAVVQLPRIRHIATGGELVDPEDTPALGKIRDTNSTLLSALLGEQSTFVSSRCGDDPAALAAIANEPCDLLLISGGASVGDYDFGAEALRRLGFTIHFDKVNLRPGKPLTFATRGAQAAFVIPGNPVSHFVCYHIAIRLAVERLSGKTPAWDFLDLEIQGGEPLRPDPRETFWPATVRAEAGKLVVTPQRWSTSGDTFSLAGTNALVRVNDAAPATLLL